MWEAMKKKTVITTETRELWVIRQASCVPEVPAQKDREIEPTSESLTPHIDPEARQENDSSAELTTPYVQK
jgi:hypothetical protein